MIEDGRETVCPEIREGVKPSLLPYLASQDLKALHEANTTGLRPVKIKVGDKHRRTCTPAALCQPSLQRKMFWGEVVGKCHREFEA